MMPLDPTPVLYYLMLVSGMSAFVGPVSVPLIGLGMFLGLRLTP